MLAGALPLLLPAPVVRGDPACAARPAAPSYNQVHPPHLFAIMCAPCGWSLSAILGIRTGYWSKVRYTVAT